METSRVRSAYKQSETQSDIHPVKLIHIMYERVIAHLELAGEGIRDEDPQKRGENLGKAIAIITELNASIKKDDDTEAAQFLRGLYSAILTELPKVSLSEDIKILKQTHTYVCRLKEIWEETAMKENGLTKESPPKQTESEPEVEVKPSAPAKAVALGNNGYGGSVSRKVASNGVVSVAI